MAYDIIGDIHGQDGKLVALLRKLGYREIGGTYRHPEGRTALFLGDLIDRGPGQIAVINIVRRMIDAGSARTIMGNHELNAIGFATADGRDGFLRPHTDEKTSQHAEFLRQVGWGSSLHAELVDWFKTLPPVLDLGAIRLCHAWWNPDSVDCLAQNSKADGSVNEEFLLSSFRKETIAYRVMEGITKGMEVRLPEGCSFVDHSGISRSKVRVRWWDAGATTFRAAAFVPEAQHDLIPDLALPARLGTHDDIPTFLGHYWLSGKPAVQTPTIAILDYSAAIDGPLVAYRWNGETTLDNGSFVEAGL